jgi:hypothetical protein
MRRNDEYGQSPMVPLRLAQGRPQCIDIFGQQLVSPIRRIDGEEETASGNEIAAVAGHAHIRG